jgi:hypothetical protein
MIAQSMTQRPPRRRLVAFSVLWLSIGGAALVAPGCYGRNCEDGPGKTFGVDPGQGRMLDANTWESAAFTEKWLWFPRQRTYTFDVSALGGRTPSLIVPYISATPEPNQSNSTVGSGNGVVFVNVRPNGLDVKNDTCSDYYLRLYLQVPPLPPEAAATESGAGVSASAVGRL